MYTLDQINFLIEECDNWIDKIEQVTPGDASAQIIISRYSRALVAFKVMLEDAKDRPYTESSLDAIRVALGFELLDKELDHAAEEAAEEARHRRTAPEHTAFPCERCVQAGAILKGHTHVFHPKAEQRPGTDGDAEVEGT
jgi:hypothetical protein